jgi:hypothetical protein
LAKVFINRKPIQKVMGSDKEGKETAKLEKKRLKAQLKAEKARVKVAQTSRDEPVEKREPAPATPPEHEQKPKPAPLSEQRPDPQPSQSTIQQVPHPEVKVVMPEPEKLPWFRDPNWVRAIVALATLIIMLATLLVAIYG